MIELRLPLTQEQVSAAADIHRRLPFWRAVDEALDALSLRLPGFDIGACLIKTAAINQLYGTNVYAVARVAAHVSEVLVDPPSEDLVEQLATVRTADKTRRHLSFASKFAHFFIDKVQYPIFDSYAVDTLRHHLRGVRLSTGTVPLYAEYLSAIDNLMQLTRLNCSGRELDQYLWLSGLHRAWTRKRDAPINVEVRDLFESAARRTEVRQELDGLVGFPATD